MPEPRLVPSLDALARDPERALAMAPEQAKRLLLALAPVERALEMAAQAPPAVEPAKPSENGGGRWLTVHQVAERVGHDDRWVYRRAHAWDFTVKDGRSLLFSERGLNAWMERHRVQIEGEPRER